MRKLQLIFISLFLFTTSTFAGTCETTFPSPLNALADGSMMLNSGSQINGTTVNKVITTSLTDNGASCDGASCVKSDTSAESYSFTMDVGTGTDGWASVDTTYTTTKSFEGLNLNSGDSITFKDDITIKFKNGIDIDGAINIDGNVIIHVPFLNQNSGSLINVISGSLTIIADDITLDTTSTISPASLVCLAINQLTLNSGASVNGLLYSDTTLVLNDNSVVTGSVTAKNLTLNANATINYDAGAVSVYCGATPPVTSVISGNIYNSDSSTDIDNVSMVLYKDDGNGQPDVSDTLVDNTTTDVSGNYSFDVVDGKYYVLVDSTSLHSDGNVSMEQTYAPAGGYCANGGGGMVMRGSAGSCYGGKEGDKADDVSFIETAEHIAMVDLTGSPVPNVDFGFNANVVTNVNDSGQGSLRAFITNSNIIAGVNKMKFVPAVPINSSSWWTVTLASVLPDITDSLTIINGEALDFLGGTRDPNGATAGHSGTVGVGVDGIEGNADDPLFSAINKVELEIDGADKGTIFTVTADNCTIKKLSFINNDATVDALAIDIYGDNTLIEKNFIGFSADGMDPGKSKQFIDGIHTDSNASSTTLQNNLIGNVQRHAVHFSGTGVIKGNDISHAGLSDKTGDGITLQENRQNNVTIKENIIKSSGAYNIETISTSGGFTIENNTLIGGGVLTSSSEDSSIRIMSSDNNVSYNVIKDNVDSGIVIEESFSGGASSENLISKNAIYNNGKISIDLDQKGSNGDGVTLNNGFKNTTLQNDDMDYPIFTKANLNGTTLRVEGFVGDTPNQVDFDSSKIEIYKVDADGDAHGEGRWYLGECMSTVLGNFSCDITTSLLVEDEFITAIATDLSHNTSEFGPNKIVTNDTPFVCSHEAYVFSSTTANDPTKVDKIDFITETNSTLSPNIHLTNINAIGYNVVDNLIWGYDMVNHTVTKTDKLLKSKEYNVAGLADYGFHIGDVSPDGVLYLASAYLLTSDGVESDGILRLYRVDVNPDVPVKLSEITVVPPTGVILYAADFAFHPTDKMLYMVERFSGDIYKINPTTGVANPIGNTGFIYVDSHIQFFDKNGYFYFFRSDVFYRCDLTDPANPNTTAIKFMDMPLPSSGDGARCANAMMGDKPILMIDIADKEVIEGHIGTKDVVFTITSDRVVTDATGLTINYTTSDGSALAGSDYIGVSGSVVMPQGSTSVSITVKINGDRLVEHPHELFYLNVSSPTTKFINAISSCLIINDDFDIKMKVVNPTASYDWNSKVSTQIVNQGFGLTVLAKNITLGGIPATDMNITKVMLDTDVLWTGALSTGADGIVLNIPLTIGRAIAEANITVHGSYMGGDYDSASSDIFAVRPKNFQITLPAVDQPAGAPFNFKIEALDALGNPSPGYNEVNGTSFALVHSEANAACITGTLTLPNVTFVNGEATYTVSYSEVGDLEFDVAEIVGSEFAKVDVSDTPNPIDRLIGVDDDSVTFIPSALTTISHSVTTDQASFFSYYSNTKSEGVTVSATIQAENIAGDVTKNYSASCGYAKDNTFVVQYAIDGNTSGKALTWFDMLNDANNSTAPDALMGTTNFPVDDSNFTDGTAPVSMKFNLGRNPTKEMEPLLFKINALSAFDIDISTVTAYPKDIPFYYGRLYTPDYFVAGDTLTATLYHEVYCKNCDNTVFTEAQNHESVDNVNWYITAGDDGFTGESILSGASITGTGVKTITVEADRLPHRNIVSYKPDSWLKYNQFNATNPLDSFKVSFSSNNPQWAGEGEVGMTADMNVSRVRGIKKIDW